MSATLADNGRRLLAALVRDERSDLLSGSITYGDPERTADGIELLDECARALTGEAPLTAEVCLKLIELAEEEQAEICRGHVSYGPSSDHDDAVVEELGEAVQVLRVAGVARG
jgi:hypothetical protein